MSDVSAAVDVLVEDTTLREGEQSPGVAFSTDEKIEIVRLLHELGIQAVEVGTPAMGGPEADAIKRLVAASLPIRLIGWNRGRKSDLDASFECGVDSVHIGLPASDHHLERKFHKSREWVVETMQELVAYAKTQRAWVSVSAEDVGRADADFLVEYAKATAAAGADRLRMSDTVGVLDPFKAYELFKQITDGVPLPVQAHMHDDFGLATANTLAAVKGGARHVHVTVNGLGERAGIGSLDEVVLGLERHLGIETGIRKEGLRELADFVARASGRPIPPSKPITGDAVFAHESGIHVEGVLKLADTFEPIMPESVGGSREIVIGKHSGSGALQHVLAEHGIEVDRAALGPVLEAVRYQATQQKRALTADELIAVYTDVVGRAAS